MGKRSIFYELVITVQNNHKMEKIMLKINVLAVILMILMSFNGAVSAQSAAHMIEANDPYVRAVPPGQPNSASFMALSNTGAIGHALTAAESPVA